MDNGELLRQLKIDRGHREAVNTAPVRWPWIVGGVLLVLLALGIGGWWMLANRALVVQTAAAAAPGGGDAGAVLQATGYVTARRQATVSAQITGTLTDVLIEEGDHVSKGQVLARLEDSAYRANLDAAQASARAALAQVGQLQAQLAQARHDAARQDALVGRGLVARQAAEQAHTQVAALAAQLNAQQRQAEAAQAQAKVAQVDFDYTVVRAPFDGVVTDKSAQVGEIISPLSAGGGFTRTGVGTIVDMDSLEVDVDVNEAYIGRVKPHMPAEAVLDAYPDWRIPAHVIAIVPAADRGKATVKVRVALENKDQRIVCACRSWKPGPRPPRRRRAACWCRPRRSPGATATRWCSWCRASACSSAPCNRRRAATSASCPKACSPARRWWCRRRPSCATARQYMSRTSSPERRMQWRASVPGRARKLKQPLRLTGESPWAT